MGIEIEIFISSALSDLISASQLYSPVGSSHVRLAEGASPLISSTPLSLNLGDHVLKSASVVIPSRLAWKLKEAQQLDGYEQY